MRDDPAACSEVMLAVQGDVLPEHELGPSQHQGEDGLADLPGGGEGASPGRAPQPCRGRGGAKSGGLVDWRKFRLSANVVNACPPVAAGRAASRGRPRVGAAGGAGGGAGGGEVIRSLQTPV